MSQGRLSAHGPFRALISVVQRFDARAQKPSSIPDSSKGALNGGLWDEVVIPAWPVDRPLPAEADANACVLDRRWRVVAVAPGFTRPQQFYRMLVAALCIGLRGVSGRALTGSVS